MFWLLDPNSSLAQTQELNLTYVFKEDFTRELIYLSSIFFSSTMTFLPIPRNLILSLSFGFNNG
jgi:hypothetical protein